MILKREGERRQDDRWTGQLVLVLGAGHAEAPCHASVPSTLSSPHGDGRTSPLVTAGCRCRRLWVEQNPRPRDDAGTTNVREYRLRSPV